MTAATVLTIVWMLPGSAGPFLVGRVIDEGIAAASVVALVKWSGLLLAAVVVSGLLGVVGQIFVVRCRLIAFYRTIQLVAHTCARLGRTLPMRAPAGEVLSLSSTDSENLATLLEEAPRAVASMVTVLGVGGIVIYLSPPLGLIVFVGTPILLLVGVPVLRPLHHRQAVERDGLAILTTKAIDIVSGLRVLRGIGGEPKLDAAYAAQSVRVRDAGIQAGRWQAWSVALGVLFSGIFLALLTWLGVHEVLDGRLSVGGLVSFFGYALFLLAPIQAFFDIGQKFIRARVSAGRTVDFLRLPTEDHERVQPPTSGSVPEVPETQCDGGCRYVRPGEFTAILCADEADERRIIDHIWQPATGIGSGLLVVESDSILFAGPLQSVIDVHGMLDVEDAEQALHAAAAGDVFEALSGDWQHRIDELGRGLSGGQRQRLILARSLAQQPEVLILQQPTSAVDAHTESIIAERLKSARDGRTTVVLTSSPLILGRADHVQLVHSGQITATGTHHDLLLNNVVYRERVLRAGGEEPTDSHGNSHTKADPVAPPAHRADPAARRMPSSTLSSEAARNTWIGPDRSGDCEIAAQPAAAERHPVARYRSFRSRHAARKQVAEQTFTESRAPEFGIPVAGWHTLTWSLREALRGRSRQLLILLILSGIAAGAGLAVPRLLGHLVDVAAAQSPHTSIVRATTIGVCGLVALQALMTFGSWNWSSILSHTMLANWREQVVRGILGLPLSRVESASQGDLVTRVTRDASTMTDTVRVALPESAMAAVATVLALIAMLANSPILTAPVMISALPLALALRSYFRHAPAGYITEGATFSAINSTLSENVEGARTIDALNIERTRLRQLDHDIENSAQAARYTMALRSYLFTVIDIAYNSPVVTVLIVGAYGYHAGWVSLGQIAAAILYVQALFEPFDRMVYHFDRLQIGAASASRLLGIAVVPKDRTTGSDLPADNHLRGTDLHYAYHDGRDVLHGITLDINSGERLAIVGQSGSGKSTLGRLLAGIDAPRAGNVTVGGADLVRLPLDTLRREVCLVTQEHHIFAGTIRDNITLATDHCTDQATQEALVAVGAAEWVNQLPNRLDTDVGSGALTLNAAQAQQIALARLLIANPHTLVLDEATSLIDPRTARRLETSMSQLMRDRTVIAIAHRLHTAHDADRIAVIANGYLAELGSHNDLITNNGPYAELWRAWTSE